MTGHTGFMGGWLSSLLFQLGAKVTGYALKPPTEPSFFEATSLHDRFTASILGDVRDVGGLTEAVRAAAPSVVFHLAAQPLVRRANAEPHLTFETNIMGTVNLLEAVRACDGVEGALVVTTDKVYRNNNWYWPYRETDRLGGAEPYSASKACVEHILDGYRDVYFGMHRQTGPEVGIAAIRAGNIFGGGDWAADRLVPDVARAFEAGQPVTLRNPQSTRPWQHVLDPLVGYLSLAEKLCAEPGRFSSGWNFGPALSDCLAVGAFAEALREAWGGSAEVKVVEDTEIFEERMLALDSAKAEAELGWRPRWTLPTAISRTAEWYKAFYTGEDMSTLTANQCREMVDA